MAQQLPEWMSLPKGFRDYSEKDVLFFLKKCAAFLEIAHELNAEIVVTPPVAYASTFTHRIETTGHKTFDFLDRKGRSLMLTPDSSPHVIRWFLSNNRPITKKRILFISPVFRYRNTRDRCWIQFGLSSFNEEKQPGQDDILALLARSYMSVLTMKLKLHVILQMGDLSIYRKILLRSSIGGKNADAILLAIRSLQPGERVAYIKTLPIDANSSTILGKILNFRCTDISELNPRLHAAGIDDSESVSHITHVYEIGRKISRGLSASCEYVFDDFHASELQDGIVVKFRKPERGHYADGGDYTFYAHKIEPEIKSWISFGGGLLGAEDGTDSSDGEDDI